MKNATVITQPINPKAIVRTHPMWVNVNASNTQGAQPVAAAPDILSEKEHLAADRATD